jgi:phosphatidylserine/phosphatidylglycerophosphate/cardiolipin synthase-like enzyme
MMHKYLILLSLLACNKVEKIQSDTSAIVPSVQDASICSCPTINVHFSPNGGSTQFIVDAINNAQDSVFVQAYSFTSQPIADALVNKKKQGKNVQAILDKSDVIGNGTLINHLINNSITVYVDHKHAIAHNKILIIDQKIVFTGSFNFTNAAEHSNAENSLEIVDTSLAAIYQKNWELHKGHSILDVKK